MYTKAKGSKGKGKGKHSKPKSFSGKVKAEKAEVKVKAEKKKTTKTVRNRRLLPDLDLPDIKPLKKRAKKESESSDDDDLKVTYVSETSTLQDNDNDNDNFVDLTGYTNTSTPKTTVIDIASPAAGSKRRSPRNTKDVDYTGKSSVKKSLSFTETESTRTRSDPKSEPTPSTSGTSGNVHPQEHSEQCGQDDLDTRVARLESLISSMEMERRQSDRENREAEVQRSVNNGHVLELMQRSADDHRLFAKGYEFALDNQKHVIKGENSVNDEFLLEVVLSLFYCKD